MVFIEAIKSIIDLLVRRKEVKKLDKESAKIDLEIDRLKNDKKQEESLITIATVDDIKKYDPRVSSLDNTIFRPQRMPPGKHEDIWVKGREAASLKFRLFSSSYSTLLFLVVFIIGVVIWLLRYLKGV